MKDVTSRLTRRRRLLFRSIFLFFGACPFLAYVASVVIRGRPVYWSLKVHDRSTTDGLFQDDAELGFASVPGARGELIFPIGSNVPVRFDAHGFRIPADSPLDDATRGPRPLVLALGCSFTFGDGGLAEDAFPHLVASDLHGTELNAGGCAWGLAQMLLRARSLIPTYRPEVTLVQFSPWLLERARDPFAPTFFAKRPQPFFVDGASGVELHSPVFAPFGRDVKAYRATPPSVFEELCFLGSVAAPVLLHDDLHGASYRARTRLGLLPPPVDPEGKVVPVVYGEIGRLCEASGSRLVVLGIGGAIGEAARNLFHASGATVVDGQAALWAALPPEVRSAPKEVRDEAFKRAYGIWRGSPPRLVDPHPSPRAHRLLADAVLEGLRANR
jgi:hypothetical protein